LDEKAAEAEILEELTLINQEEKEKREKQKAGNNNNANATNPLMPALEGKFKLVQKKTERSEKVKTTEKEPAATPAATDNK